MQKCSNTHITYTMKRRILTFATCLCLSISTLTAKSLVMTLTDGTLVYYLLGGDVNPMLRFVNGEITVNTDAYSFSNLKNFYISLTDDPNGIEHKLADVKVSFSHHVLTIPSVDAEAVRVYSTDGTRVHPAVRSEAGFLFVDLSHLPQGIYAVKVGDTSLKVVKND